MACILQDTKIDRLVSPCVFIVEISCTCNFCGSYYGCCLTMHVSFSLFCALNQKDYILISVYCSKECRSLSSDCFAWLHKGPSIFSFGLVFFLMRLISSRLGLMIFHIIFYHFIIQLESLSSCIIQFFLSTHGRYDVYSIDLMPLFFSGNSLIPFSNMKQTLENQFHRLFWIQFALF